MAFCKHIIVSHKLLCLLSNQLPESSHLPYRPAKCLTEGTFLRCKPFEALAASRTCLQHFGMPCLAIEHSTIEGIFCSRSFALLPGPVANSSFMHAAVKSLNCHNQSLMPAGDFCFAVTRGYLFATLSELGPSAISGMRKARRMLGIASF